MKKNAEDWTDFLATSDLPDGNDLTFVETNGTTFGLDRVDFDTVDNAGAEDSARLPETKGLAGLPDGIVTTAEEGPDFVGLMKTDDGITLDDMLSEEEGALPEDKTASTVNNLDWLDPTQGQDLSRLPRRKPVIPQLDNQWGGGVRTDGLTLIPNIDKDIADWRSSVRSEPKAQLPQDVKDDAVRLASRLLHYGQSFESVIVDLAKKTDVKTAREAVSVLEEDAGLAGKVFVRASSFPGLRKGQWLPELKKIARGARWVITDDPLVASRLGMEMVSNVPWYEAERHYFPKIASLVARKLASHPGDPKRTLKEAFAAMKDVAEVQVTDVKPVEPKPTVASAAVAGKVLRDFVPGQVSVKTREEHQAARKTHAVLGDLVRWVKEGKLSSEAALKIKESGKSPEDMSAAATKMILAATGKESTYGGIGTTMKAVSGIVPDEPVTVKQAAIDKATKSKVLKVLAVMVKRGTLTRAKAESIVREGKTTAGIRKLAAEAIQSENTGDVKPPRKPKAVYEGTVQRQAVSSVPDRSAQQAEVVEKNLRRKAGISVGQAVKAGLLDRQTAEGILRTCRTSSKIQAALERNLGGVTKSTYQGIGNGQVNVFSPRKANREMTLEQEGVLKAAKISGIKAGEIAKFLKDARIQMTEGLAGSRLDQMINAKFSKPLIKASRQLLKTLRHEHEGLSGHLYVDAAAYASSSGTTGCEKNAAKHRMNGLKFVLAMSRCKDCVFANVEGVCQQYNKKIAWDFPREDLESWRQQSVKMADASDAETTAAMFNPSEYGLQDAMEFDLEHRVSSEKLGDVLFGGFEIGEGD
jgi:hypothetical protein